MFRRDCRGARVRHWAVARYITRLVSDLAADRPYLPAPLVALAGWILPGLGYVLIGQRARGLIAGITILATFVLGLLIGGVRVVDVPGYDAKGQQLILRLPNGQQVWALKYRFVGEVFNKPWYIAQTLVGPANIVATWGSLETARQGTPQATARIYDIGVLYTAVAGMLNLLVIIDAAYRSTKPRPPASEGRS